MKKNSIHSSDYQALIALIKRKREHISVTQAELADLLDEDQSWVSKIERCERRIDVAELRSVCLALGISLSELISDWEASIDLNRYKEVE